MLEGYGCRKRMRSRKPPNEPNLSEADSMLNPPRRASRATTRLFAPAVEVSFDG